MIGRVGAALGLAVLAILALGCTGGPGGRELRVEQVASTGDATRRASTRLVLDGLGADAHGNSGRALSLYERAIQVDAGNPYAYLALARFHVEQGDAPRALVYLDRAEDLFDPEERDSPRVEAHFAGLRGNAYQMQGRMQEGGALLVRAARSSPTAWGDGWLSADELR